MLGTIVNAIAIAVGGVIGSAIKTGIPSRMKESVVYGLGLVVLFLGFKNAQETLNPLIMIGSIVVGAIVGEALDIDALLQKLAKHLEKLVGGRGGNVSEAFVTTTLIYCVGAMAITGAMQSGLTGDHSVLYAKSMLDGISGLFFAASLGIGVALSAIPVFVYQGIITVAASSLSGIMTAAMTAEMTAVGGLLIIAIGLNILGITKIRVANLLPGIAVALLLAGLL